VIVQQPGEHADKGLALAVDGGADMDSRWRRGSLTRIRSRTVHRLEETAAGMTRIIYRTEITGSAADRVGPQLGPAITADFPDVLAALVRVAETPAVRPVTASARKRCGAESLVATRVSRIDPWPRVRLDG
jgi:hypothetical protein